MDKTAVVKGIYDSIDVGNFGPLSEVFGPDAEWHESESFPYWVGRPFIGTPAVIEGVFARVAGDFSEFGVELDRIDEGETFVLVQGRYVGTTTSGRKLSAQLADVFDFDGDAIVRFQQYTDTWQWRQVLGTDPSEASAVQNG